MADETRVDGRDHGTPPVGGPTPADAEAERGLSIGASLGRYVLSRRIGEGGMGVVYEALDPQLGRRLAIKVLWPGTRSAARAGRLRREAQAMAQLNHPNVVKVFDVGTEGDQVYIAMELVEGTNLAQWLATRPHKRSDILSMLRRAGEGLVAAHEVGLVHRDFKPANVLVSDDDRVLVTDFGLARPPGSTGGTPPSTGSGSVERRSSEITGTGARVGTPAYMAPEQHRGAEVDARADQYSFCVTVWEALSGRRPFDGKDIDTLQQAKTAMKLREDDAHLLPRRIRAACVRGLSPDAAERWPDLRALLDALQPPNRRALGLAVVGGLTIVAGWWLALGEPTDPCVEDRAETSAVWDEGTRARVRNAMVETEVPYAAHTAAAVESHLDGYVAQWLEMHGELCGKAEPDPEAAAAQLGCLRRRRAELAALIEVLASADAAVVERAVHSTADLLPLGQCRDPSPNAAWEDGEAPRESVENVRRMLDKASALGSAGHAAEGLEVARRARDAAKALGRPELDLEATLAFGVLQRTSGDARLAEGTLADAFWRAHEIGNDMVAMRAATELVTVVGADQARHDEGLTWARHAAAAVERAGGHPRNVAALLIAEANLLRRAAEWDEARSRLERAREIKLITDGPEHLGYASLLNNIAALEISVGRYEEAREAHESALAIERAALGDEHPTIAITLSGLGAVQYLQGHYEEAKASLERALALRERTLGADHPLLANTLNNLGITLQRLHQSDRALEVHRRALTIRERALGPSHPDLAESLNNIGVELQEKQQWEEAEETYERALAIQEGPLGPEHPSLATALGNLGTVIHEQGRHTEAFRHRKRALEIAAGAFEEGHPTRVSAMIRLAESHLALGELDTAKTLLERALPQLRDDPQALFLRGDAAFALARALVEQGAPRDAWIELIESSLADYEKVGHAARREREAARAWLRSRIEPR